MDPLAHLPGSVIHLPVIAAEHSRRIVYGVFVFLAAGLAIAIITALAYGTNHPLVVPRSDRRRSLARTDGLRHLQSISDVPSQVP
jgi:uncharacterized protein YfaA (DUF2138 family)